MTTQKEIAPQLQEILEDVASDPRSQVLRVPKLRVPLKAEPAVRDREALLTQAERQLVKVHRFEVADLLLQEVRRAVMECEERGSRLLKYVSGDEVSKAPDPIEWESRARYRVNTVPDDFEDRGALSLLQDCVRTVPGERPSTVQLAAASLRLLPIPSTRICLGLALHQAGQTFSGLSVLWDVLAGRANPMMQSYAWQNIAELEWSLGHSQKSLEAVRSAALISCGRGDSAMSWFVAALQEGERAEILRAAHKLEDAVPVEHPSVDSFTRSCIGRHAHTGTIPDGKFGKRLSSLAAQLPEQARRIGQALSITNS